MSSDDDDDLFGPRSSKTPPSRRPMPVLAAALWSIGATFVFVLLVSMTVAARPAAATDLISHIVCQAAAYLLALFLILRVHAPDAAIRDFLGLRGTHPAFFPLAALLGVFVQLPVNALYTLIERRWPAGSEDDFLQLVREASTPKKIAIGVVVIVVGPILEEIFFRGALWKPLARTYAGVMGVVLPVTATLFAIAHGRWQTYLPIALVGLALGFLRHRSGSILPSMVLHASFNSIPLVLVSITPPTDPNAPDPMLAPGYVLASTAASLVLLGLIQLVGARGASAIHARELDAR